jgi:hypothetical protein
MKKGSLFVLFCSYEIHPNGVLQIVFLVGKPWRRRGASAWFQDIWTCRVEVLEY